MTMKISDILNITNGELINEPSVQAIEGATVFPSKVDEGDLFIATNIDDIPKAVENGAYAIIFEGKIADSIDNEIAWIEVSSVKNAAMRLLRYVMLHKQSDIYLLKPHEMSFLKMIAKEKRNLKILPQDWIKSFEAILNGDERLFLSEDRELVEIIEPEYKTLAKEEDGYIINGTLFRTTFRMGEFVYQDKELAPFHLEYLLKVVHLCKEYQIPYSINRLRYTKHFLPIFIDGNLSSVSRGSSYKVAIFCDNLEDIEKAKKFTKEQTKWTKSIVLTPPKTKIDGVEKPIWFDSVQQARDILKKSHFNYAFIYSLDRDMLNEIKSDESIFEII